METGTAYLEDYFEANGFLTRKRSEKDERSVSVFLTPSGEALREKAVDIPMKVAGCTELNKEEAEALYKTLYKILRGE